jgi:hypothetical protein
MDRLADQIERIQAMIKSLLIIKNEEGSAIVVALLTLMVVTIIGVSASNQTTSELQVVRNEGIYKQNLYLAEGAAQEAIQKIWNLSREDPFALEDKDPDFLNTPTAAMDDVTNWDADGADGDDTAELSVTVDPNNPPQHAAVDTGIADDGSLEMTATSVHTFFVYGLSEAANGRVFIQIGYRERY